MLLLTTTLYAMPLSLGVAARRDALEQFLVFTHKHAQKDEIFIMQVPYLQIEVRSVTVDPG